MELKDDSYLRQKVDEIAQSFDANYQVNDNGQGADYIITRAATMIT